MKLSSPRQRQGADYEALAERYLRAQGLILVCKNWHCKSLGELDLVMLDKTLAYDSIAKNVNTYAKVNANISGNAYANGNAFNTQGCLVFVEVRQRQQSKYGTAEESITPAKQRKIIRTAQAFLQAHPQFEDYDIRFDVVSFTTGNPSEQQDKRALTQAEIALMTAGIEPQMHTERGLDGVSETIPHNELQPNWIIGAFTAC